MVHLGTHILTDVVVSFPMLTSVSPTTSPSPTTRGSGSTTAQVAFSLVAHPFLSAV